MALEKDTLSQRAPLFLGVSRKGDTLSQRAPLFALCVLG